MRNLRAHHYIDQQENQFSSYGGFIKFIYCEYYTIVRRRGAVGDVLKHLSFLIPMNFFRNKLQKYFGMF